MSKTRFSYVPALLIFPVLASMSASAIAQGGSSTSKYQSAYQSAAPVTFTNVFDPPPPRTLQMIPNDHVVEETVDPTVRYIPAVGLNENYHPVFTYDTHAALDGAEPGDSALINDMAPGDNDTPVAENFAELQSSSNPQDRHSMQGAPPPPEVKQTTRDIKRQTRRWHVGGRIGAGFSPELFMFGLQSQIGPIFNPRLLFRPNADFSFGELTDMFALNLEAAYRLRMSLHGGWDPYFGMGPALNFIHQGTSASDVSFSDFTYKTGFNVFVGAQKNKTFVEMKTSLWSGPAPVLRLILGYNF